MGTTHNKIIKGQPLPDSTHDELTKEWLMPTSTMTE